MPRVDVSLPLRGPSGSAGRDVLRGVELALARPGGDDLELVVLDGSGDDRDELAATHARRAVEDGAALAYLGDFHSSQVLATAPVLSEAGLLQVAPVATFTGLGGSSLVRLMPNDAALARAVAAWLEAAGVRSLLVVHDHDDGYGVPVGRLCADAARERGLDVRARPIWDHDEAMDDDVRGVVPCSTSASPAPARSGSAATCTRSTRRSGCSAPTESRSRGWRTSSTRARPRGRASSARSGRRGGSTGTRRRPWPSTRSPPARATASGRRRPPGRHADRDSVLGRYSLDADGLTTETGCGVLAVVGGELAWAR